MSHDHPIQKRIEDAIRNPRNLGEMEGADAIGTVGSPDCGDMLRMWVKFREDGGRRVIDKASFQTFGCETAIAVASLATELIAGKTVDEALALSDEDLSAQLGPLPPMKIHCAQLVEGALRSALSGGDSVVAPGGNVPSAATQAPSLSQKFQASGQDPKKVKVVLDTPSRK
jgi:nitrogen fixation NifU-like protein